MIAQLVTKTPFDSAPARTTREGRGANGRAWVAFRLRCDLLRHLSTALLLLAFSAFILQPLAHASPSGHSVHHDAAIAAVTQLCIHSHASGDGHEASVKHCDQDKAEPGVLDCCQACLVAAITLEAKSLSLHADSEHLSRLNPNHFGRTPPGILRPPRLITAA